MEKIAAGDENQIDYKLLFLISALLFSTKFFILCSTMNFMMYYEGENGANMNLGQASWVQRKLQFMKFTAVGPLIFVTMKIFAIFDVVILAIYLPFIIIAKPCGYSGTMIEKYKISLQKWQGVFLWIFNFTET
jgi:hypothetical protein